MKNIRLNNDMRDAFISKVMVDVPTTDFDGLIRSAIRKAAHAALPLAIKKLIGTEFECYLHPINVSLNRHTKGLEGTPTDMGISVNVYAESWEKARDIAIDAGRTLYIHWIAEKNKHAELKRNLRSVAYHCTTRNQLAEAFPEFARYLPESESDATRNLPALANVVTDFVKAGWPKDGKKPATKKAVAA